MIRLSRGEIYGDEIDQLYDHLDSCPECQQIFFGIEKPDDNFRNLIAGITPEDLKQAKVFTDRELLNETAVSVVDFFSNKVNASRREPVLQLPCTIRQYDVTRLIGMGGMGEVYEAQHTKLKRRAAVKVIRSFRQEDPAAYDQFIKEIETAGQLGHPNLVLAHDAWEDKGCHYLIQEYLEGESLHELGQHQKIGTTSEVIEILLGTCRGLDQLHAQGFVHRDVTPRNVMRLHDGTIKLIDFGLTLATESGKTVPRSRAGTPGYMSPEQTLGNVSIDHRSDIYSVGRVLMYLLSKLPEVVAEPKRTKPVQKLTALAERLTQQKPKDRLQSVYAVIVLLEQLEYPDLPPHTPPKVDAPPIVPPPPPVSRTQEIERALPRIRTAVPADAAKPKPKPKHRGIGGLILVALMLAAGGFAAFQIIFKTDRQATVFVENHQPGDVIRITSEDGEVRSVELGHQAKFAVDRGTYKLSLEGPDSRRLSPASITVTGQDQLTVRIEDRIAKNNDIEPTITAPMVAAPMVAENTAQTPNEQEPISQGTSPGSAPLTAPLTATDIRPVRQAWSNDRKLPEMITVGMPNDRAFQLEFVLIPPGTFEMGMPATLPMMPGNKQEWVDASRPAHQVTITQPFYLSPYEVTQKQFRDVMGGGLTPVTGDGTKFPATQIPWDACVDFCDRLSNSGTNIPEGGNVRLPTEAEWEYACRAGTTTRFWSGNEIGPRQASLRISGRAMKLEPVNSFQPNPFGLYQVHGNVAEWCSDWFSPGFYASSGKANPRGPTNGSRKVIRGGGYSNPPFSATSYWRQSYEPDTRSGNIGLRPVIELSAR